MTKLALHIVVVMVLAALLALGIAYPLAGIKNTIIKKKVWILK